MLHGYVEGRRGPAATEKKSRRNVSKKTMIMRQIARRLCQQRAPKKFESLNCGREEGEELRTRKVLKGVKKGFDSPLKDFPFGRVVEVEPTGRFGEKELCKARFGRNHWMFQLKGKLEWVLLTDVQSTVCRVVRIAVW